MIELKVFLIHTLCIDSHSQSLFRISNLVYSVFIALEITKFHHFRVRFMETDIKFLINFS